MLPRYAFAAVALSFGCCSPDFAGATVCVWSGGVFGGGQFTEPGSWFDSSVPTNNTTSDIAQFYGFAAGPIFTTVNLSTLRSVRGLDFRVSELTGLPDVNFTFTGSKLTLGEDGIRIALDAPADHVINNPVGLAVDQLWELGAGFGDDFRVNKATLG